MRVIWLFIKIKNTKKALNVSFNVFFLIQAYNAFLLCTIKWKDGITPFQFWNNK